MGFKPWSSQVVVGDHTGTITLRAPDPQAIARVCIGDMSGALIIGKPISRIVRWLKFWEFMAWPTSYWKLMEKSVLLELSRSWGCFHGAALHSSGRALQAGCGSAHRKCANRHSAVSRVCWPKRSNNISGSTPAGQKWYPLVMSK